MYYAPLYNYCLNYQVYYIPRTINGGGETLYLNWGGSNVLWGSTPLSWGS